MRPRQNPSLSYDRPGLGNEPRQPVVIPTATRTWESAPAARGALVLQSIRWRGKEHQPLHPNGRIQRGATATRIKPIVARAQEISRTKIAPHKGGYRAGWRVTGRSASARVAPASGVGVHSPAHARPGRPRDYPAPEDRIRRRRACRRGARYQRQACGGACGA
jgi:hypothetical protein